MKKLTFFTTVDAVKKEPLCPALLKPAVSQWTSFTLTLI